MSEMDIHIGIMSHHYLIAPQKRERPGASAIHLACDVVR